MLAQGASVVRCTLGIPHEAAVPSAPMSKALADTHQRALAINLDASIYGSFAEIGAGQEVARWFFHVGGAAGTVARTISAYDMAMSDAVYGKAERYVSRARLEAMLAREHSLLVEQLGAARGAKSRFFAFADTVSARNYAGTNECHGWIGLRFQHEPGSAPSDVILHVNLMDSTNLLQQQAVGILGVHLIHAAYHTRATPREFLTALFDELSLARIEVDVAELRGPAFQGFDARATALQLLLQGLTPAVVFGQDGAAATPSELMRKRPIVIERGRYRTTKPAHGVLLAAATRSLRAELPADSREPLGLFEVSLAEKAEIPAPSEAEILLRVARLTQLGFPVAVTRFRRAFELTEFVRRYTREPVRLGLGASNLVELLMTYAEAGAAGDGMQALGRLLSENVRIYVFPMPADLFRERLERAGIDPRSIQHESEGPITPEGLRLPAPMSHIHAYLISAGWLVRVAEPRAELAAKQVSA